ncbi:MAG: DUF3850 domain-containing protein [Candidatus Pacebacteria bacterium]|nr:DUF3850 domain-containing protein [Candidatus Paceibacterota bacterium]
MATIRKKAWPELFELVKTGKKNFDLRLADFDVQEGDTLILEEWDPETEKYTGRILEKTVKYVMAFNLNDFGQKQNIEEKGLYIIQL